MHEIEQTACDLLAQGQVFVLAAIVRHKGATPSTAGSKMIIACDGLGIGTINAVQHNRSVFVLLTIGDETMNRQPG